MKLITKIWLTLLLVIAVTLLATAWLTNRSTGQAYRGYFDTFQHYQLVQLANQAGVLYADMGQWQPVQDWLNQTGATMLMPSPQRGRGRGRGAMGLAQGQAQYLLVDAASGAPLAADTPPVSQSLLDTGEAVVVDGVTVAKLVTPSSTTTYGPAEQSLLGQVRNAILISVGLSGVVAILLGGLLVATILRPLRELGAGVAKVARGSLRTRQHLKPRRARPTCNRFQSNGR